MNPFQELVLWGSLATAVAAKESHSIASVLKEQPSDFLNNKLPQQRARVLSLGWSLFLELQTRVVIANVDCLAVWLTCNFLFSYTSHYLILTLLHTLTHSPMHTPIHSHPRTHAQTHTTHTRTHAQTHTHTHTFLSRYYSH